MNILLLHNELLKYLRKRRLEKKFLKQKILFERNPFHPGLETELLEPKNMRLWSFRVDRKYRAIFIISGIHPRANPRMNASPEPSTQFVECSAEEII